MKKILRYQLFIAVKDTDSLAYSVDKESFPFTIRNCFRYNLQWRYLHDGFIEPLVCEDGFIVNIYITKKHFSMKRAIERIIQNMNGKYEYILYSVKQNPRGGYRFHVQEVFVQDNSTNMSPVVNWIRKDNEQRTIPLFKPNLPGKLKNVDKVPFNEY